MPSMPKYSDQAQEDLILDSAAKCIQSSSLLDFTMSAISKEAGLSMGSIYKHIQSKEDVLVALGYRSKVHFKNLVHQIFELPLPPVAKIVAVQLMDHSLVSDIGFGPQLETLLGNESILKRASRRWLEKFMEINIEVEDVFTQLLLHACESSELLVAQDEKANLVNEIVTSSWSLCVGHTQVAMQRGSRNILDQGIPPPVRYESDATIIQTLKRLLNTYQWKSPLTSELIEYTCGQLQQSGLR